MSPVDDVASEETLATAGEMMPAPGTGAVVVKQPWDGLNSEEIIRRGFLSSIKNDTPANRLRNYTAVNTRQSGVQQALTIGGLNCKDMVVSPMSFVDKDGEVKVVPKIVVVQPDGGMFAFHARTLIDQITSLLRIYGPPPYDPPLVFKVEQMNGANGFRWYKLNVSESPAAERYGKKKS